MPRGHLRMAPIESASFEEAGIGSHLERAKATASPRIEFISGIRWLQKVGAQLDSIQIPIKSRALL